jgi:hypothetical protein
MSMTPIYAKVVILGLLHRTCMPGPGDGQGPAPKAQGLV